MSKKSNYLFLTDCVAPDARNRQSQLNISEKLQDQITRMKYPARDNFSGTVK